MINKINTLLIFVITISLLKIVFFTDFTIVDYAEKGSTREDDIKLNNGTERLSSFTYDFPLADCILFFDAENKLCQKDGALTFEGNAEESAKEFLGFVIKYFPKVRGE